MRTLFLLLLSCAIAQPHFAQDAPARLDELMSAYAKLDKFSGSILVTRKDSVLINKGYGFSNITRQTPNNDQTIFMIASVTKPFTSAVILKLAEMKKLSLSDTLGRYFPGFPRGDSITLIHLLSHTSGIFNYTNDPGFTPSKAGIPRYLAAAAPDFQAGKGWSYSNSGYYLLGMIIEKVTGLTYEQAVRQYIFEPLEMWHSGFDFKHLNIPAKAVGYYADTTEKPEKPAPLPDSTGPYAAGAIYSNTGDLYKWHRGLQTNQIISKASQLAAYTRVANNYGYGWQIDSVADRQVVSHSGGIPGFRSNLARVPADDICIVLLSNNETEDMQTFTEKILSILYARPYTIPREKKAIQLPLATLQKYAGVYDVPGRFKLHIILEGNRLFGQPEGRPRNELFAQTNTRFFLKEAEVELEFETGRVTIYQGERTLEGKKLE